MSPFYKNLALWLVISLMVILLFNMFHQPQKSSLETTYSQFLASVQKGDVAQVTIQGDHVFGTFIDGKTVQDLCPTGFGPDQDFAGARGQHSGQTRGRIPLVHERACQLAPDAASGRRMDFLHAPDADGGRKGDELRQEPRASAQRKLQEGALQ